MRNTATEARAFALLLPTLFLPLAIAGQEEPATPLILWTVGEQGDDRAVPVGSLQKPFVAQAWSRAHPGAAPPRFRCEGGSTCWRPSGHGVSGMSRAVAISCNAYFRQLAAQVPADILEATLRESGFTVRGPLSPESAIGLPLPGTTVSIRPSALLAAYVRLTRTPWAEGDGVRQAALAGLRDAAWTGTASGLARRGVWAKTGTVPALDAHPLKTSGWAIAVDDSGWACLALLPHGTGRDAATALGRSLDRLRPGSTLAAPGAATRLAIAEGPGPARPRPDAGVVRVALFAALHPRRVVARNAGWSPVASSRGFVGAGGRLSLLPGDRLEEGLWDLETPGTGLTRRLRASIDCREADRGLGLVARMSPLEYVSGVILAELPEGGGELRTALGAAILRFLATGPRHPTADVCDTTHCAWFIGRGPRVGWPEPDRVVLLAAHRTPGGLDAWQPDVVDPAAWSRIVAASQQPGPSLWTRHCGGQPLSPHALWGDGDRRVFTCSRHRAGSFPWTRRWRRVDLERALGVKADGDTLEGRVSIEEADPAGVWALRVGSRVFRYDEAHRLLAAVLGWDALPSPASRLRRVADGYEVEGVGSGHRVGLCLAD